MRYNKSCSVNPHPPYGDSRIRHGSQHSNDPSRAFFSAGTEEAIQITPIQSLPGADEAAAAALRSSSGAASADPAAIGFFSLQLLLPWRSCGCCGCCFCCWWWLRERMPSNDFRTRRKEKRESCTGSGSGRRAGTPTIISAWRLFFLSFLFFLSSFLFLSLSRAGGGGVNLTLFRPTAYACASSTVLAGGNVGPGLSGELRCP